MSLSSPALAGMFFTSSATWEYKIKYKIKSKKKKETYDHNLKHHHGGLSFYCSLFRLCWVYVAARSFL